MSAPTLDELFASLDPATVRLDSQGRVTSDDDEMRSLLARLDLGSAPNSIFDSNASQCSCTNSQCK